MYWNLTGTGDEKRLAQTTEGYKVEFKRVVCSVNPAGHNGLGDRTSPLSIVLQNIEPDDFVWTWASECLVQEHVLYLFKTEKFTGYEPVPVHHLEFDPPVKNPPRFWEIVVKGSAGIASVKSGAKILRVCPGCGAADYSRITDSTRVIDASQWDGSDFFRVKPLEGYIFVTDRVIEALKRNAISGWCARSLADLQKDLDSMVP